MTGPSLARRERHALCDLALALGEDAPTLCGEWDAKQLVAHLLVREYSLGAVGLVLSALEPLAEREMARVGRKDFGVLVERLRRRGPTPLSLPLVDEALNTLEYFVHHEDLRRAQPGWEPREQPRADQDTIWRSLRVFGPGLVRPVGCPVKVRRTDTGRTVTLRRGTDPVVLSGLPSEITLHLFGRGRVRGLEFAGPADRVTQLKRADLGV